MDNFNWFPFLLPLSFLLREKQKKLHKILQSIRFKRIFSNYRLCLLMLQLSVCITFSGYTWNAKACLLGFGLTHKVAVSVRQIQDNTYPSWFYSNVETSKNTCNLKLHHKLAMYNFSHNWLQYKKQLIKIILANGMNDTV